MGTQFLDSSLRFVLQLTDLGLERSQARIVLKRALLDKIEQFLQFCPLNAGSLLLRLVLSCRVLNQLMFVCFVVDRAH